MLYGNADRMQFNALLLIFLTLHESLKVVLKILVVILMMSVKLATPGLLKINMFLSIFLNCYLAVPCGTMGSRGQPH